MYKDVVSEGESVQSSAEESATEGILDSELDLPTDSGSADSDDLDTSSANSGSSPGHDGSNGGYGRRGARRGHVRKGGRGRGACGRGTFRVSGRGASRGAGRSTRGRSGRGANGGGSTLPTIEGTWDKRSPQLCFMTTIKHQDLHHQSTMNPLLWICSADFLRKTCETWWWRKQTGMQLRILVSLLTLAHATIPEMKAFDNVGMLIYSYGNCGSSSIGNVLDNYPCSCCNIREEWFCKLGPGLK